MQLSHFLLFLAPALTTASECVSSGPRQSVQAVKNCCAYYGGKWCGTTPYQGICVIADGKLASYKSCTKIWGDEVEDRDCIPGDGSELTACKLFANLDGRSGDTKGL
ncbi:hypothetical protein B0O99DRAFT_682252 [Bisporella sp. PMI_857]|nr:hypothetical protein B0O99DRAFT_682737 [Bisporella sp. PMI_857]KAH8600563.1 hypothetical protein B0O99DRAFT_682252 [Bisporella sp. PMI_857]